MQSNSLKFPMLLEFVPINPLAKIIEDYIVRTVKLGSEFDYPFSFLNSTWDDTFTTKNIIRPVFGEEPIDIEKIINFPTDIDEVYFVQEGSNDEQDWILLCRNTQNIYLLYDAYCDCTGFTCQAGMSLYAFSSYDNMVDLGLEDKNFDTKGARYYYTVDLMSTKQKFLAFQSNALPLCD
jgi:hypothetical protein